MARTRTFVGVDIGSDIRARVASLQKKLAAIEPDVKWTETENLHITLCFLGEVDDREIPTVCRLVQGAAKGHAPFPMTVETVGAFPHLRTPRILWVGVNDGADVLTALHDGLEPGFEGLGYRREERRYKPHVTLGRVRGDKTGPKLAAALAAQANWHAGETTVQEILVMGSHLGPQGPRYTVLGRAKLRGPS